MKHTEYSMDERQTRMNNRKQQQLEDAHFRIFNISGSNRHSPTLKAETMARIGWNFIGRYFESPAKSQAVADTTQTDDVNTQVFPSKTKVGIVWKGFVLLSSVWLSLFC